MLSTRSSLFNAKQQLLQTYCNTSDFAAAFESQPTGRARQIVEGVNVVGALNNLAADFRNVDLRANAYADMEDLFSLHSPGANVNKVQRHHRPPAPM